MTVITIHPKSEKESSLFENLAKMLNIPYEIREEEVEKFKKKPSDFFGSISESEGKKMHDCLNRSREEWERNI